MSETGTHAESNELLSSKDVARTVARIAHQIIEKTALDSSESPRVLLLGIPSGGVPLAQRLAEKIEEFSGVEVPWGSLDITLYRDDLYARPHRALQPTTVPAGGINGATVILVDDVLYSGRTIRADYVGKNIPTAHDEDVTVYNADIDGRDAVILTRFTAQPGKEA